MPVTINQPLMLSATKTYRPIATVMHHFEPKEAFVTYGVFDDTDKQVDATQIHYTGEEFNTWFANFNTGTFLDEELKRILGIEAELPQNNEDYYYNEENA
jgi:hypothetical protein